MNSWASVFGTQDKFTRNLHRVWSLSAVQRLSNLRNARAKIFGMSPAFAHCHCLWDLGRPAEISTVNWISAKLSGPSAILVVMHCWISLGRPSGVRFDTELLVYAYLSTQVDHSIKAWLFCMVSHQINRVIWDWSTLNFELAFPNYFCGFFRDVLAGGLWPLVPYTVYFLVI